nr:GSU2403 family nucleotidyltransferase fold protein [Marinicaulis flavus]
MPSLKTDAAPLRFLDFLLKETVQAAVLSKTGVLINVPTPERYAVHKLIVSTMRHSAGESAAKADKDVAQAATLIEAFSIKRRLDDSNEVLRETKKRGAGWRERLQTGTSRLPEKIRALSTPLT